MLPRTLMTFATTTALLLGGLTLGACNSDDEVRISPVPAGYAALLRQQQYAEGQRNDVTEGGRTVDELLAAVDGEYLTRANVLRQLRLTEEEAADDPDIEDEILTARLDWAKQRLIMGAARRAGLRIPPSAIDSIVDAQLEKEMEENEPDGVTLTPEEYLRERELSREEYRDQIYGMVVAEYYVRKLFDGVGAARPNVDKGVSPAEVRQIYFLHREKFNERPGVKIAMLQLPIQNFEAEDRDFLEAEEIAGAAATRLAREFKAGAEPLALAEKYKIPKGNVNIPPTFIPDFPQPDARDWLFEPARKAGDVRVFRDAGGPIILGVVDTRPARQRDLSDPEVYDLIVNMLQGAKRKQLAARLTIDLLQRGNVVWPDELADELLDDAQGELDLIASHEIVKRARLR